MTAPTEAEIRAYLDAMPDDTFVLQQGRDFHYFIEALGPISEYFDGVDDDDFAAFDGLYDAEIERLTPQITAALRPLIVEA